MKIVRVLSLVTLLLATALAGCASISGSVDAPTAAIRRIRSQLDLPQQALTNTGPGMMANAPNGSEAVINYQDGVGRIYSYDPSIQQVIEIDARARLSVISPDVAALPLATLRDKAKKLAAASTPDFKALAGQLTYEEGNKGDNYFFSWSLKMEQAAQMAPFLQIALYKNGELFAYYNTLGLR